MSSGWYGPYQGLHPDQIFRNVGQNEAYAPVAVPIPPKPGDSPALLLAKPEDPMHYSEVWPRPRPRPLLTLARLCGYLVSGMAGYLLHMAVYGA